MAAGRPGTRSSATSSFHIRHSKVLVSSPRRDIAQPSRDTGKNVWFVAVRAAQHGDFAWKFGETSPIEIEARIHLDASFRAQDFKGHHKSLSVSVRTGGPTAPIGSLACASRECSI